MTKTTRHELGSLAPLCSLIENHTKAATAAAVIYAVTLFIYAL